MYKVNEIAKSLEEIDSALFQKLCDGYIAKMKLGSMNSIGSQFGANKTIPGTPDTYILRPNGMYIFIEYTTQKDRLKSKILEDIDKCLDNNDLEVPKEKIEKIIYCHNRRLNGKDTKEIYEFCYYKNGVNLDIYGIDHLSCDLAHIYPDLAEQYLHISWVSGDVLNLGEFIKQSTLMPLDNEFFYREKEILNICTLLHEKNILILRGPQGVGKTRLAIESFVRYQTENPKYEIFCIDNKSMDIKESIHKIESYYKNILILLDDANRIDELEKALTTLTKTTYLEDAKIILTVRDYALNPIKRALGFEFDYNEVSVNEFQQKDLYNILKSESIGRLNEPAIKAILTVSKGNIRIAILAARRLLETNDIRSISEVPKIFDKFFQELLNKIQAHESKQLKQVLAIIAFYHKFDSDRFTDFNIYNKMGINETDFWECIIILNQYEIVDLYPTKRLCAISDQLQAAYFFYKYVIEEEVISFNVFLENFVHFGPDKIRDALVPSTQIFGIDTIREKLYTLVVLYWEKQGNALPIRDKINFSSSFSFIIPEQILVFTNEFIDLLSPEMSTIDFSGNIHGITEQIYQLLRTFTGLETYYQNSALLLGCKYFYKRPQLAHEFVEFIKYGFGFSHPESLYSTEKQSLAVTTLIEESSKNSLLSEVICNVAPFFLGLYHEDNYTEGRTFTMSHFYLPFNNGIKSLHRKIWTFLLGLTNIEAFFVTLKEYIKVMAYPFERVNEILSKCLLYDIQFIFNAIKTFNDDLTISRLKIISSYLSLLEDFKIEHEYIELLSKYLEAPIYKQYELISGEGYRRRRRLENWDYNEAIEKQVGDINNYLATIDKEETFVFLENIKTIRVTFKDDLYDTNFGVSVVYKYILNTNFNFFYEVIESLLNNGNTIYLDSRIFMNDIFNLPPEQINKFLEIIRSKEYNQKSVWIVSFFTEMPRNQINSNYYNYLIYYFENEFAYSQYYLQFDFLIKFEEYKPGTFINLCHILFNSRERNKSNFTLLLNQFTEANSKISVLFKDDMDLLEKIWIYMELNDNSFDHNSKVLSLIMENNELFIIKVLEAHFENDQYYFMHNDDRDYSYIWSLPNSFQIVDSITEYILSRSDFVLDMNIIKQFFALSPGQEHLRSIQTDYLDSRIKINCKDVKYTNLILVAIKAFHFENAIHFIKIFLQHNTNLNDFKGLCVDFTFYSGNGTFLEPYTKLLNLWEQILTILTTPELLPHRLYVKGKVESWKYQIERENRKLFHFDLEF